MAKRRRKNAQDAGRELTGHMIQNNGEDLEYLQSLSKVSDKELGEFWDQVREMMEAKKATAQSSPGEMTPDEKADDFLERYGL